MKATRAARRTTSRRTLLAICLVAASFGARDARAVEPVAPFEFALVGDYPYWPRDDAGMPHLLEDLRRAPALEWVLHLGDLHHYRATECGEALFRARRGWFVSLGVPFVLTPGDNDWADCGEEELLELEAIRRIFFEDPRRADGPDGFVVRTQADDDGFPEVVENALWERGGVVFATLHMIGHSRHGVLDEHHATKRRLVDAGRAWMAEAFRVAEERDARGVFLATQVSLWPATANVMSLHAFYPELRDGRTEFDDFERDLIAHTRRFARPVVLANGDTHTFRIDKPLFDHNLEMLHNFTRVEGFGSPAGHWVRVRVEPEREEVFSFRQEWVPENMYTLTVREERDDGFEDFEVGPAILILRAFQLLPYALAPVGAFVLVRGLWRWIRARRA